MHLEGFNGGKLTSSKESVQKSPTLESDGIKSGNIWLLDENGDKLRDSNETGVVVDNDKAEAGAVIKFWTVVFD